MKRLFLAAVVTAFSQIAHAQDSTDVATGFTVSGYLEAYYNHDFNRPSNHTLPSFMYNFNRAGEVSVNLGFIKGAFASRQARVNVALAVGTYMNANYAAEPGVLKNIYEANVGVRLSKNSNLWLDAGIMPSHIGFEGAVGKDNWAMTRSLAAENSPYFESGVKLNFTSGNDKLYLAAMYLNGWQRIQRADGNSTPAFGTQVTYRPTSSVTLNYSTFIGNDKPDSLRSMRYYHNLYGIFQFSDRWGVTAGFDIGTEQKYKSAARYNRWLVPVVIVRYSALPRVSIAIRGEYFRDRNGVIIAANTSSGFSTWGFSANVDYLVAKNLVWRTEARTLSARKPFFVRPNEAVSKSNTFVTSSLAVSF